MSDNLHSTKEKWSEYAHAREEGRAIRIFGDLHPVVGKYRNDLYLEGLAPFTLIRKQLPEIPCSPCLEIACGMGNLARGFIKAGFCSEIDAYDLSDGVIDVAKRVTEKEGLAGINFKAKNANNLVLKKNHYKFIYISQALHHIENLENFFEQVNHALTDDGLFYFRDYVGPSRMQWTEKQMALMDEMLSLLPDNYLRHYNHKYQVKRHVKRTPIEIYLKVDPTEGVRSDEILPLAEKYMNISKVYPMGGTITYELLRGRIHNFDENNEVENALLKSFLLMEKKLIDAGDIPSDFVLCFATKKA